MQCPKYNAQLSLSHLAGGTDQIEMATMLFDQANTYATGQWAIDVAQAGLLALYTVQPYTCLHY